MVSIQRIFQPTDREHMLSFEIQKAFATRLVTVLEKLANPQSIGLGKGYKPDLYDAIVVIKDEFELPL